MSRKKNKTKKCGTNLDLLTNFIIENIKGTRMQIWKAPYMLKKKKKLYLENFVFLTLITLELFTHEVRVFLKN